MARNSSRLHFTAHGPAPAALTRTAGSGAADAGTVHLVRSEVGDLFCAVHRRVGTHHQNGRNSRGGTGGIRPYAIGWRHHRPLSILQSKNKANKAKHRENRRVKAEPK